MIPENTITPIVNIVGDRTIHQDQLITFDNFNPANIALNMFIKNTKSSSPFISYIPNSFLMNHIPSNASNHNPPLVITNTIFSNQNNNLPIFTSLFEGQTYPIKTYSHVEQSLSNSLSSTLIFFPVTFLGSSVVNIPSLIHPSL